jgi:hypothetical protein
MMEQQQLPEMLVWWRQQVLLLLVWCAVRANLRTERQTARERERERARAQNLIWQKERNTYSKCCSDQDIFFFNSVYYGQCKPPEFSADKSRYNLKNFDLVEKEQLLEILVWLRQELSYRYSGGRREILRNVGLMEKDQVFKMLGVWRQQVFLTLVWRGWENRSKNCFFKIMTQPIVVEYCNKYIRWSSFISYTVEIFL